MTFHEAFTQYIKNKKVTGFYSVPPYGNHSLPPEERFYGDGIEMENGYKYISFGGGCSGEDCNASFIVSPENKLVAVSHW